MSVFFPTSQILEERKTNSLYLLSSGVAITAGYVFLFGNIYPSPRRLSGAISCYLGKSLGLLFINIYSLVPVPHLFFFFLSSQVITLGAGRRRRQRRPFGLRQTNLRSNMGMPQRFLNHKVRLLKTSMFITAGLRIPAPVTSK